eukprot:gb/GECG01004813.1/.p1 GENE.gb/GECG01004813.1/~~gb/GECG01004813.1/.p1  ORF type:complete len:165 (+),score=10.20 gb/GECG01004813.1/:1-495(+)
MIPSLTFVEASVNDRYQDVDLEKSCQYMEVSGTPKTWRVAACVRLLSFVSICLYTHSVSCCSKTLGVHWHFWHLLYAITPATALWFYAEYREPRARSEHGSSFLSRPNNPKDLTDTAWKVRRLEEELQNISSPVDTQQSPERRGCSESGDASEKLDKIDNRSNR